MEEKGGDGSERQENVIVKQDPVKCHRRPERCVSKNTTTYWLSATRENSFACRLVGSLSLRIASLLRNTPRETYIEQQYHTSIALVIS